MAEANKTIVLKGCGHQKEAEAAGALLPGMDINLSAAGLAQKNSLTKAEAIKGGFKIAIEDGWQGQSIRGTGHNGDTTYTAGNTVFYYMPQPGDEINLLVKDGEVIARNDAIVPEGGGTGLWIKAAGTEASYPFRAMEALSPSGSNGFIACEYQG